jgi:hypothetical protein
MACGNKRLCRISRKFRRFAEIKRHIVASASLYVYTRMMA